MLSEVVFIILSLWDSSSLVWMHLLMPQTFGYLLWEPSEIFSPKPVFVMPNYLAMWSTFFFNISAAVLDVIFSWKARRRMSFPVKLRYILKVISAAAWVIILSVTYAYSWKNPTGLARTIKSWLGDGQNQPSLYILAVVIYLSPNMLAALLFLFPFLRRFLERSNYKIITLMMWWSQVIVALDKSYFYLNTICSWYQSFFLQCWQPRLYVGRGMHESSWSLFKYD